MKAHDYGPVKILQFSNNITNEELEETSSLLAKWGTDKQDYAIISYMPDSAKTVTDIPTIKRSLSLIKNSGLKIYGKRTNQAADYLAKIVAELLGLRIKQFSNYSTMINEIETDLPDVKIALEEYDIEDKLNTFS